MIGVDMLVGIGLPEPLVLHIIYTGIIPRITLQMADTPSVAHSIAGCGSLGMETVVNNCQSIVLGFENLTISKTNAKTVRIIKTIEINLWLGMMVGRIGRPFSGII